MAGRFQPPPTYASPIALDEFGNNYFSPIWIKWFNELIAPLGAGATPSEVITDGIIINNMFGLREGTRYAQDVFTSNAERVLEGRTFRDRPTELLVTNDQSILMNQIFGP